MAKLSFTNSPHGFISDTFEGGVSLQCIFAGNAKHVLFLETRLSSELPWTLHRSIVIKAQQVINVVYAAEGQEYRLRCGTEPESVDTSKLKNTGGGSGSGSGGDEEMDFEPEDFDGIGEDEARSIVADAIAAAEGGGSQGGEP